MLSDKPEALMQALSQNFSTNPAQFKSLNNEFKLNIQLGNASQMSCFIA
jgi:ABC-2 type transport system ATP-binding protein